MQHKDVVETVGGVEAIMERFKLQRRAVLHAIQKQSFPASWFNGLEKMAGTELPRQLFSFK